jgi:nucleoside-diphosphate-sugar epimerase
MRIEPCSVLVTGGAGFIGSHIVDALLAAGCRVSVIDNLSTGRMANLSHVMDRITFHQEDIRDAPALHSAAGGVEMIFHEAAVVSVPQTVADPVGSAMVNDIGTLQVLETARRQGVRRVVLASSCAVYGDDPKLPKTEAMAPKPMSPYALQKLTGEGYARLYGQIYGLETACLRYFNVFGPRQDPSSPYSGVISIFMSQAARGQAPVIYGDGGQSRDFVYVADVVAANLLAGFRPEAAGGRYNVGTGHRVTINALWAQIARLVGIEATPRYEPARPGDIYASLANVDTIASLGFAPRWSFEKGLDATLAWYLASNVSKTTGNQ